MFRKKFGSYNTAQLIESGYLSITVINASKPKQILGFLTLNDNPRNFPHGSERWLELFNRGSLSQAEAAAAGAKRPPQQLRISNTLWVDFFVSDSGSAEEITDSMFQTVFSTLPEVDYIVMSVPKGSKIDLGLFSPRAIDPLDLTEDSSTVECQEFLESVAHICERESVIPTLRVREACVEDNEDLLPIFDSQSDVLSEQYGGEWRVENC